MPFFLPALLSILTFALSASFFCAILVCSSINCFSMFLSALVVVPIKASFGVLFFLIVLDVSGKSSIPNDILKKFSSGVYLLSYIGMSDLENFLSMSRFICFLVFALVFLGTRPSSAYNPTSVPPLIASA